MSSRNSTLDLEERQAATVLFRALSAATELFDAGERTADRLRAEMEKVLAAEALAQPEYTSVADLETLEELNGPIEHALLSIAIVIGKTRLIDNMTVGD
jgi:pantoate--beta-alanine ligase